MRVKPKLTAAAVAALMTSLSIVPTRAQEAPATPVGTDIGTFYKDEVAPLFKKPGYSPYAGRNYPTRVLWGDTHLHTANSLDAAAFGNTLGPGGGLPVRPGEEVVSSTGQRVKLSRPLDFLVVADHAEGLGATIELKNGNPLLMADPTLKRWHDMMAAGPGRGRRDRDDQIGQDRHDPEAAVRSQRLPARSGRPTRRRPSATTSRAASPP